MARRLTASVRPRQIPYSHRNAKTAQPRQQPQDTQAKTYRPRQTGQDRQAKTDRPRHADQDIRAKTYGPRHTNQDRTPPAPLHLHRPCGGPHRGWGHWARRRRLGLTKHWSRPRQWSLLRMRESCVARRLTASVRRQRRAGTPRQGERSTRSASPWPKRPTTASIQDKRHPRRKASKTKDIQDERHPRPRPPTQPEDPGVGVAASSTLPTRPGGLGRAHGRLSQVARLTNAWCDTKSSMYL